MLYTNYKQIATIVLNSGSAIEKDEIDVTIKTVDQTSVQKYTFNINLPFYKFTKNTKLAVQNFVFNSDTYFRKNIGDVYIKNIKKSNVYHSNKMNSKGTCILSDVLTEPNKYINPDVINNSIDITGNTSFLEGNPLEIIVDTKVCRDNVEEQTGTDINGCPSTAFWTLTLTIYEEEKEENKKDVVEDKVKNYSKPLLY